ncbi:Shedu immune nuclease family protein [Sphingobacterium hungaricum]
MSEEISQDEYYANQRSANKTYFSKSFEDSSSNFMRKYAYKILDYRSNEFFLKNEITLGNSDGGLRQLKAFFLLDEEREIEKLIVQQFDTKREPLKSTTKEASFHGEEVERLYQFLKSIKEVDFSHDDKFNVRDKVLSKMLLNKEQANRIIVDNLEILQEALKNNVTTNDIINFGYRKSQLEIFQNLLASPEFFTNYQKENNITHSEEAVWQYFFEKNTWIFGYGLDYIFNSELDERKLEQVTSGSSFNEGGKRIDAFLKSQGAINSLCFCELKLHTQPLLKQNKKPYRSESWQISDDLAGAISQVQRTVQKALKEISTKTEIKNDSDYLTGETVYLYNPKAFILIGNLNEFIVDGKTNEVKYSSFEIFRKSLKNIEILTFDELYQRAYYICHKKE